MNVAQDVIVRIQGLNKTFRGRAGTVVALNGIDLRSEEHTSELQSHA